MSKRTTNNYIKVSARAYNAMITSRISRDAFCFYCYLLRHELFGHNVYNLDGVVCDCWFYRTDSEASRAFRCPVSQIRKFKRELEGASLIETHVGKEPPIDPDYERWEGKTLIKTVTWYNITD